MQDFVCRFGEDRQALMKKLMQMAPNEQMQPAVSESKFVQMFERMLSVGSDIMQVTTGCWAGAGGAGAGAGAEQMCIR